MFAAELQRQAPIRLLIGQLPATEFSDQTVLAAVLAALGAMIGWIGARAVQSRRNRAPQAAARADNRQRAKIPRSDACAEEPPAQRRRSVLDISALTLADPPIKEPLDLTVFVQDHAAPAQSLSIVSEPDLRDEAQRALHDSLAALRELRGAA